MGTGPIMSKPRLESQERLFSRPTARLCFLETMRELALKEKPRSKIFDQLADEVLPLAAAGKKDLSRLEREVGLGETGVSGDPELHRALREWASRWCICEPWVLASTIATLRLWTEWPEALADRDVRLAGGFGGWMFPRSFDPDGNRAYNPTLESRGNARERLPQRASTYFDRREARAKAGKAFVPVEQLGPKGISRLVRFQVLRHPWHKIARDEGLEYARPAQDVKSSAKKAAERIDLPLRLAKRGKPKTK